MTSQVYVVTSLLVAVCWLHTVTSVSIPPAITLQSPKNIYYKVNETVKITCEASGEPHPGYSWKRNEIDFNPAGNDDRITQSKSKGTLIINSPEDKDEGIYQCFAKNSFGVAVSIKYNLRMAKLDTFKNEDAQIHRVQLGDYLRLSCQSPDSVPDAEIYWVIVHKDGTFKPVDWNSTISMDYEDRLHFAHVSAENYQSGQPYRCMAYNPMMRATQVGPPHYIVPQGASDQLRTIQIAWPKSRFNQHGLVGSTKKFKCIFSGNPTPLVHWRRADQKPFPSARTTTGNSDGQELIIEDLQFSDAGGYVCNAQAMGSGSPVEKSFNLTINSAPTWIKAPKNLETGEGATAIFECVAAGAPQPQITWYINGQSLEMALRNNSRLDKRFKRLEAAKVMLERVTKEDTMVFQCNATNTYGYVWGEAYLNVLDEAPSILQVPQENLKVAENKPFLLTCFVTGKPDPIITWFKNDLQITGGRYVIQDSGNLYVAQAVLSDAGVYRCEAVNKHGRVANHGSVIVRRKTVIEQKPRDLEVTNKAYAKFICSGTTDPEETDNLKISWLKDYKDIEMGERFFRNEQDNSLILSGAQVRDTGTFTCVLSNGLDNDTASARLEVTDVPDRPYSLDINNTCKAKGMAELVWVPGSFNNAPIEYYSVEYSTLKDPDNWVFATKVGQTKAKAFVKLFPGLNYKFRVTSVNRIGSSTPSVPTTRRCATQNGFPVQNPRNVRTIGDLPGKIHLEWTPVPPKYQGGFDFSYSILIKKVGLPNSVFHKAEISDWRVSSKEITYGGLDYEAFEITVKSINENGNSPEQPETIIGYSAESMPIISPTDMEASVSTIDEVVLSWTFPRSEILKTDTKIKGAFNGFQIQMWEEGRKDATIRQWFLYASEFSAQSTGDTFNTSIRHLAPNAQMLVTAAVMNNYFIGKPSESARFQTLPGLPGPVSLMEDEVIGENHITIRWSRPLDDRTDIIGYDIGYQQVKRGLELDKMQERQPQIDDPFTSSAILDGLYPLTKYRIHIWARTVAGRGESYFIERSTGAPAYLETPRYSIASKGSDHINVTWWRDQFKASSSVVYVEYKKTDSAEWFSSSPDVSQDWVNIPLLQPGMDYQVRVAVTNGYQKKVSIEEDVTTDGIALAYDVVGNLGWFLGILFSLLLHIGLIILFCFCYQRGFRFTPLVFEHHEVQTFQQGGQLYTDHDKLGEKSEHFAPEPRGHTNDYYDERDSYEEHDGEGARDNRDYSGVEKPPAAYSDVEYEDYKYDNSQQPAGADYPRKLAVNSDGSNEYPPRDGYDYDDNYDRDGRYDDDYRGGDYDDYEDQARYDDSRYDYDDYDRQQQQHQQPPPSYYGLQDDDSHDKDESHDGKTPTNSTFV